MRTWQKLIATATMLTVVLTVMVASVASGQDNSEPQEPPAGLCPDDFSESIMDFLKNHVGLCSGDQPSANAPVARQAPGTPGYIPPVNIPQPTGGRFNFATYYCPVNPGPGDPAACSHVYPEAARAEENSLTCPETWLCDEEHARPTTPEPILCYERAIDGSCLRTSPANADDRPVNCIENLNFTTACEVQTDTGAWSKHRFEREFCWEEESQNYNHLTGSWETVTVRVCNVSLDDPALN